MNTDKRLILIVDTDEILRNGMRLILEAENFLIEEACDGKEALEIMKDKSFSLIISDFEMPELDGVQLLAHTKSKCHSKFMLISDMSTALQARQAFQLGADAFLNKPFSKSEFLKNVVDALSSGEIKESLQQQESEYIQVPITEFITGSTLKVDIYLRLSDNKSLKVGRKGEKADQAQLQAFMKKGVNWLYMRKQDFAFYVGFNIVLAQKAHSKDSIECAKKIRLTMHITSNLISQLKRAGVDRQQLEDTSNVVINAVELISSSPDTMKLLENMDIEGSLPAHSIAVSIWSCLIAKELGWTGQSTFFKIAICGLFHDVGTKEIDDPLANKSRFELTKKEVKMVEGHTLRGRDILQSVPGIPNDVVTVALQHHELYRGGGYPYGLKYQEIHPLSLLVSLADRFCEIMAYNERDAGLKSAFEQLNFNRRDFDPAHFKALSRILENAKVKKAADAA